MQAAAPPTGAPWVGPRLQGEVGVGGRYAPLVGGAHLHLDVAARRGAGRLQHLRAGHDHLHRGAALP